MCVEDLRAKAMDLFGHDLNHCEGWGWVWHMDGESDDFEEL